MSYSVSGSGHEEYCSITASFDDKSEQFFGDFREVLKNLEAAIASRVTKKEPEHGEDTSSSKMQPDEQS